MVSNAYKDAEYTSQKSIRFYVKKTKENLELHSSMYTHMLIEDLRLGIMPIGWQPRRYSFECELEPKPPDVEKLIIDGLPTYHGTPYYFTEAICDFVEEATHIIACYGKAYYEIVYLFDDEKKEKVKGFQLINIPNTNIRSFLGCYWQYLPKEVMKYREQERKFMRSGDDNKVREKKIIWLPKQRMFTLRFPQRLGGIMQLKRIMSALDWVGQETVPKFSMKDMELQKQQAGYDFSTYRDNQDIFVLKLTKQLGWPARSLSSEKMLEFYTLYRYMVFARTQAILREYIVERFNILLGKIGKEFGFSNKIIIKNCISADELSINIEKLMKGELQFSEIPKLSKII